MLTVAVVGTHTEVGKTSVTAELLRILGDAGVRAVARKPIQSFDPADPHPTDADVLAAASDDDPALVCPPQRWLRTPMAPPMAAAALGLPSPSWGELAAELVWPDDAEIGFVELVGGVRSPVAEDADCVHVISALAPDHVVLVADAGLGTIDRVRLAHEALAPVTPITMLNRFDSANDLHRRNAEWLRSRDGIEVAVDCELVAALLGVS